MKPIRLIFGTALLSISLLCVNDAVAQHRNNGGNHRTEKTTSHRSTNSNVQKKANTNVTPNKGANVKKEKSNVGTSNRPGSTTAKSTSPKQTTQPKSNKNDKKVDKPNNKSNNKPQSQNRPGSSDKDVKAQKPGNDKPKNDPGKKPSGPEQKPKHEPAKKPGSPDHKPQHDPAHKPGGPEHKPHHDPGHKPGGPDHKPNSPAHKPGHDSHHGSAPKPGHDTHHGHSAPPPGHHPHHDYKHHDYHPPRPGGGHWGPPPHNYHYHWSRPLPPPPPVIVHPHPGVPVIDMLFGVPFGMFIDYSINYLVQTGYNVLGYANNAIYMTSVSQFGYTWDDVQLYYNDGLFSSACLQYWSSSSSMSRFNNVYNQLCSLYGSPVSNNSSNGITSYTWWGGNQTGYVTLEFGYGRSDDGYAGYFTTVFYGSSY